MKSKSKLWLLTLVACLMGAPTWATTRVVSVTGGGQYTTMIAAYSASAAGDTILVGPGTYNEAGGINQQRQLVWIGAGWDQTTVTLGSYWYINTVNASHSEIQGFRVEGGGYTLYPTNSSDSTVIRRCLIHSGTGYAIFCSNNNGRLYVDDCLLIGNSSSDIVTTPNTGACVIRGCVFAQSATSNTYALSNTGGTSGTVELYDNVFLSLSRIFNYATGSQPLIAVNNAFYGWGSNPTYGNYPGASTFDYNASSGPAVPGTNGVVISGNPFVNFAGPYYVIGSSDVHLANGSNLIDAGHPSMLDVDGSRSDIGCYGGPKPLVDNGVPNYPWAVNLILSPNLVGQGTPVNATAIGRVGPQY